MQETEFIQQNKEKWKELESVLDSSKKDPDRLTTLFIETTDDLSYSRTFYQNRSVKIYLNRLAQQVYQTIYKNKRKERNRLGKFWLKDLPEAMWHHRSELLQSTVLFAIGLAIGMISSIYYPNFDEIMLGSSYVQMTEENIAQGNPMGVYQDANALDMFFRIALNNIRISFLVFVFGIVFGIGTYFLVLYNSVMVGAFIYFFIERDLFREAFLAIMLHGTLELSMIILSGCAGLALARGLLFPGTFKRSEALLMSARYGIKIMVAVSFFLVIASLIESFATRFSQLPGIANGQIILDIIRLVLIAISTCIVVGYFVVYPRYRFKKGWISEKQPDEIPVRTPKIINTSAIKTPGKIFTEAFFIFSKTARSISLLSILTALFFCLVFGIYTNGLFHVITINASYDYNAAFNPLSILWVWDAYTSHLSYVRYPLMFALLPLITAIWIAYVNKLARPYFGFEGGTWTSSITMAFVPALCFNLIILLPASLSFFLALFLCPFSLLLFSIATFQSVSIMDAWRNIFRLLSGNYFKMILTFLLILIPQWLSLFILNSGLTSIIASFIQMNLPFESYLAEEFPYLFETFILFGIPSFLFSLSLFGTHLFYFSICEMNEAKHLQSKLSSIGIRPRAYGLEKEI